MGEKSIELPEKSVELPEECWEIILKNIRDTNHWQSVCLVCKQFLHISNRLRPSMKISKSCGIPGGLPRILGRFTGLQEINLQSFDGKLERLILDIARSGLHLKALCLKGQGALPLSSFAELGKSCGKTLRSLNCSRFHFLQDEDILAIAKTFPFLEELDISSPQLRLSPHQASTVTVNPGTITDEGIRAMARRLSNLKIINISGNYLLSDSSMFSLSSCCKDLKEITVFGCPLISDWGLQILATHRVKLSSLAVNGLRISSFGVQTFLSSAKTLQYLDLSLLTISDELLMCMRDLNLPLRSLVLAKCKGISIYGLRALDRAFPLLTHLNLEGAHCLTDETMEILAQSSQNIKSLCLNFCSLLTDSTFFSLLRHCRMLEELEMESTALGWGSCRMNPALVSCKLSSLRIAWNKAVRNVTLRLIASLCPRLVLLDVSHCFLVTDSGLKVISKGCPEMKRLILRGCRKVVGAGIEMGLNKVEYLQAEGSGFTDSGLWNVARLCKNLVGLDLQGCLKITDLGLRRVMEECKQVKEVNVRECESVNMDALAWMVFSCPSLRRLVPPSSCVSSAHRALLLRHGCRICTANDDKLSYSSIFNGF
eukprot:TRINITY_DN2705_c0_g1_i1.p1 TRINITY_DN2705_c0_g1~~TRINITY_DN2705_c0_g1_i1.p1  ORF type:complete len:598 (+),score=61.53 TRINITY_DN2705_c0_g1_i1:714-2507(+)